MVNREQLESLRAKWNNNVTAARRSLGKALLSKTADVPEARRVLALAKQTLEEVEAMLLVVDEVKEPEREPKQEVKHEPKPEIGREPKPEIREEPKPEVRQEPKRQPEPEPERLWDEEVAWKTLPRIAHAEYEAAKKRFEADYEKLKGTRDLLIRGKELATLAKASGKKETSDCKGFLRRFGGSPELHNLV